MTWNFYPAYKALATDEIFKMMKIYSRLSLSKTFLKLMNVPDTIPRLQLVYLVFKRGALSKFSLILTQFLIDISSVVRLNA
jgi:hypothetical protein